MISIMDKNFTIYVLIFLCVAFFVADVIMILLIWQNRRREVCEIENPMH